MPKDAESKAIMMPPYIPFPTFRTFIETLHNTTIPPRIDSSVTPTMSGQMRGALSSCLVFLGLIDKNKQVSSLLKPLVDAFDTDDWRPVLSSVVLPAYLPIIGDLEVARATGGQLVEHFRENGGVDGQVLEKAIRFYLSALDESGIPYSPLFKTRGSRVVRKKQGIRPKPKRLEEGDVEFENGNGDGNALLDNPPHEGLVPFVVPFPDKPWARLWVPRDLSEDDWALIDTIGRAYVKRTNKPKEGH